MRSRPPKNAPLVLVVDDHPGWNEALQALLGGEGWRTVGARDGAEALELCAALDPALVLLGLELPVMDGLDFLRHFGARETPEQARAPVITLSALTSYARQSLDLGAVLALETPVGRDELLDAVAAVLGGAIPAPPTTPPQRPSRGVDFSLRVEAPLLELAAMLLDGDVVTASAGDGSGRVLFSGCAGPECEASAFAAGRGGDSPCQLVMAAGRWLGIGDLFENPLFRSGPWREESGMLAYAGAPLRARDGRIAGTLAVHSRRPRVFSHADQLLLQAIADEASTFAAMSGAMSGAMRPRQDLPHAASALESARRMLPLWIARSVSAGETLHGTRLLEAAGITWGGDGREIRIRMG